MIRTNEIATIAKFSADAVDANGKALPRTSTESTMPVRWMKVNTITEDIADIVTSVDGVYRLFSDKDFPLDVGDEVTVDGSKYAVLRVGRGSQDAFFVLRATCQIV